MRWLFFFVSLFAVPSTFGQSQTYTSAIDDSLTIKKVMVIPLVDNVSSIYAKPLTEYLVQLVKDDRQWNLVGAGGVAQGPEELADNPKSVLALLKKNKADALFAGRISKGPKGLSLHLEMIGGRDGLPLAQDTLEDFAGYETEDLRLQLKNLFENIKLMLPYQGLVLSRQGQVVTINLGERHGVKAGQEVLAVLVTSVLRHPKFHFITQAQREIMGRIRISKVDESISFGAITEERSANLIQPGFKVPVDRAKTYPDLPMTADGKLVPKLNDRADQPVAFGDQAREYQGVPQASFGRVDLLAGITSTNLSTTNTNSTSAQSTNPLSPTVQLEGEMWFDPRWQMNLDLTQMMAKVSNGLTGSTPDPLNLQFQQVDLAVGYNFLARDEFFGPKFQLQVGYSNTSLFIDDSTPRAHTSKTYSGLLLALGGSIPMQTETGRQYLLGGRFIYHLSPDVSESPGSSGSASNQINEFAVFGELTISPKLYLRGVLSFEQIGSSFSGGTSSSSSANFTTFLGGLGYMF